MPYAIRNENGEIIALTASPNTEDDTQLGLNDPEVMNFLANSTSGDNASAKFNELLAQDFQQIRIVEDLIDLLTAKGVIMFSELPVAAQEKILRKKLTNFTNDHMT